MGRIGWGTLITVNVDLKSKEVSLTRLKGLCLNININASKVPEEDFSLIVVVLYIPPWLRIDEFILFTEEMVILRTMYSIKFLIAGDFNVGKCVDCDRDDNFEIKINTFQSTW